MKGTHSNIYVSVAKCQHPPNGDNNHLQHAKTQWLISVEQHQPHAMFMSHRETKQVHYTATKDSSADIYGIKLHSDTTHPVIGAILIAENVQTSPEHVHGILAEDLTTPIQTSVAPDELTDHWIRRVLHILLRHCILEAFEVDDFMRFAQAYATERDEGRGLEKTAFSKKEGEGKKHGFWVSSPMARTHRAGDVESRIYGGLM